MQPKTILSLETSSANCSVALQYAGKVYQRQQHQGRGQAEIILPLIDELLTQNGLSVHDLDLLTFSAGPASFTGVRLATSIVQAFSVLHKIPVIPLSSLQIQAQPLCEQYPSIPVVVCNNAYMGEVYFAQYRLMEGIACLQGEEQLCSPQALPAIDNPLWIATGDGWQCHQSAWDKKQTAKQNITHYPEAKTMMLLAEKAYQQGHWVQAEGIEARYLRNKNAWKRLSEQ